jgi:hypothetical protein
MGMHIWYSLALGEEATSAEAIAKLTELHRYAQTVGFLGTYDIPAVGELKTGDGTEAWPPTHTVTRKLGNHREQHIHVPAMEWVGFSTMPGLGTESAYFDLARYPKTFRLTEKQSRIITSTTQRDGKIEPDPSPIAAPAEEVVVDAVGWSSSSGWCKTQYANRHGLDHFLHCHLALIKLLDYAQELGILERVGDDGGYWESRSADVLVSNLAENDRIVAAFVGALNDQIGPALEESGYVSVSPIASAPDFEHLEAEGKTLLGDGLDLASQAGPGIVSIIKAIDAVSGEPILAWPAIDFKSRWPRLLETIGAMQQLNPMLNLRIVKDRYGVSYLRHALSSRDVFHLFLPYSAPDYLTTTLTQKNETRRRIHIDGEWANIDPTRIERTVDGHLFIRPCSSGVRVARFNLGRALITHFGERIPHKAFPGWCLLPEADGAEYFEFDWAIGPKGSKQLRHAGPKVPIERTASIGPCCPEGSLASATSTTFPVRLSRHAVRRQSIWGFRSVS